MRFIIEAVGEDVVEDIALDALFPDGNTGTADPIIDVMYDILEACSPRPYWVDTLLCAVTAKQWHTVAGRLAKSGIVDPLRQLPSLSALLAAVEQLILADADAEARASWFRHYQPPPEVVARAVAREREGR